MKLSEELLARGFVYQCSAESVAEILDGEKRTVYLGIDPTADAIHIGNLVPFMMLNHIMNAGHRVILLLGGGTALIGDPSGRDLERELASVEKITDQAAVMEKGIRALSTGPIEFVNNYEWLSKLSALEFMRDVGKYFTVNAMIKKDAVSTRMESEQGISYTEFSYALLQSYDYYHLHQTMGADVQIGGSDQWGNLISGVDYIRRVTGDTVYALTMPLIVDKATGKKFGKSMGNAVWLNAERTSPYALYQFWLNTSDESVIDYLKLFTFLSLEEIAELETRHQADLSKRLAQKKLAQEVVRFVHKEEAVKNAEAVTGLLFGDRDIGSLDADEIKLLREVTTVYEIDHGLPVVEALIMTGLAASKREARTFITDKAVYLNDRLIETVEDVVDQSGGVKLGLLKRGKKLRAVLELK